LKRGSKKYDIYIDRYRYRYRYRWRERERESNETPNIVQKVRGKNIMA
jgi:hypothetical protein